jgi:Arc/MetJ-type ribon-helix-helix transcriptional regulator
MHIMFRTQIQLTPEQARALKRLASKEGKSVSELIRLSVDAMLRSDGMRDPSEQRQKALMAAGALTEGPEDLSTQHDRYLTETIEP